MGELNPADVVGAERPGIPTMLGRAAVLHCPRCGAGRIFTSWWCMKKCCPRCDLDFEGRPEEGHFLGAMTINIGLTAGILLLGMFIYIVVLAVGGGSGPPVWFVVVTSAILAVVMPAFFYPFTKTTWVAAEIVMNRFDPNR